MNTHQTWSVQTVKGKLEIHIGDQCAIMNNVKLAPQPSVGLAP